jgi:hypothetical protein
MGARLAASAEFRDERNAMSVETSTIYRDSADGDAAAGLILGALEWDATAALRTVRCPVLVLHHLDNTIFSVEAARTAAAMSQNARLVTLDGVENSGLGALFSQPPVPAALEAFLPPPPPPMEAAASAQSGFRTVLFTDLVGHTEMMSRLGDARGREVLREHDRITRDVLAAHGGTEVKTKPCPGSSGTRGRCR